MAQYTTDENLAKRIAIHGFSVNPVPWVEWYVRHLDLRPGMRLLDIGCGNGFLWHGREGIVPAETEIRLADSSPGMIEAARARLEGAGPNWRFDVADVESLPYESGSIDLVMANHMLYHASSIDRAIAEIARVVTPAGRVLASTNGARHMAEIRRWIKEFEIMIPAGFPVNVRRFGLENGALMLSAGFEEVTLDRHEDSLAVPAVQPVIDYILSMEPPDTEETRRGLRALEAKLEREIAASGAIRIRKESGLFTARGPKTGGGNHG